jgi:hypothetical protein
MAAPQQWTRQQKLRGGVWAAALGAVIIVGTLTGAQLKSDKQKTEVRLNSPFFFHNFNQC